MLKNTVILSLFISCNFLITLSFGQANENNFISSDTNNYITGETNNTIKECFQSIAGLEVIDFLNNDIAITFNGSYFQPDLNLVSSKATVSKFKRLMQLFEKRGIKLVIVPIPPRPLIFSEFLSKKSDVQNSYDFLTVSQKYTDFIKKLNQAEVLTVDVYTPLLEYSLKNKTEKYLNELSTRHWTALGAEISAHAVAQAIKSLGIEMQSSDFQTQLQNWTTVEPMFLRNGNEQCNSEILEQAPIYTTTKITSPNENSKELFEETQSPVAYVGSSYGNKRFHFSGFLSQYLGVDVTDLSIAGGGPFGSLERLLAEDLQFLNNLKIVIWEFPFIDIHQSQGYFGQNYAGFSQIEPWLIYEDFDSKYCETIQITDNDFKGNAIFLNSPKSTLVDTIVFSSEQKSILDGIIINDGTPNAIGFLSNTQTRRVLINQQAFKLAEPQTINQITLLLNENFSNLNIEGNVKLCSCNLDCDF